MKKASFILAGVFLAGGILGGILLAGILVPKYQPFTAEHHTTCGQPVTMRAEGYNLLGGTRYGRGPDDSGDDLPLANIDLCDPFVERRPDGEERLWFWFEVEVIGQVFPYAAWGLPWEDIGRLNPADDRHPTDPIWGPDAIWAIATRESGPQWAGRQAQVCTDWDTSGLAQFFNGPYGYTIPYGTTRAGWVCLTFSTAGAEDTAYASPLPDSLIIASRPSRARLTRWVDSRVRVNPTASEGQDISPEIASSHEAVCRQAETARPGSLVPDGPCTAY